MALFQSVVDTGQEWVLFLQAVLIVMFGVLVAYCPQNQSLRHRCACQVNVVTQTCKLFGQNVHGRARQLQSQKIMNDSPPVLPAVVRCKLTQITSKVPTAEHSHLVEDCSSVIRAQLVNPKHRCSNTIHHNSGSYIHAPTHGDEVCVLSNIS